MDFYLKTITLVGLMATSAACTVSTPAQHEVACVGGTLAGAAIGGAIGNRFGGGTGQTIATAAGVFTGGATTARSMGC
ncbi:hypothetical protein K3727_06630 [Rhodobacteraceae bacterium M382]|nr:hypothetical protein K3727_06630 [Rhodobacteraceae bacterium M382]